MIEKSKQLLAATAIGLSALAGSAFAIPSATTMLPSSITFEQYAGTQAIGSGKIDSNTLFWAQEQTFGTIESFVIFFDPSKTTLVGALLDFGRPIQAVFSTTKDLKGSSVFESASFDYKYKGNTGLEKGDVVSFAPGSSKLELIWSANNAGDAIRVLTAVPEPSTYAMFGLGLLLVGMIARRRIQGAA